MSRLHTHCGESTLLRRARRDLPSGGLHPSLLQMIAARFAPYAHIEHYIRARMSRSEFARLLDTPTSPTSWILPVAARSLQDGDRHASEPLGNLIKA
jgi:hypothetical protein